MSKKGSFSKDLFFEEVETPLKESYTVNFEIGRGAYSKVYEVTLKNEEQLKNEDKPKNEENKIRACKYIIKENFREEDLDKFREEIKILKELDHPNIVKLYQLFETKKSFYLIMEKCEGGNLFNKIQQRINTKTLFDENVLSELIRQITSAIQFCHEKGICHRDLKPENICFTKLGDMENNSIKIIDFGFGKYIKPNEKFQSEVGTILYMAPEVFQNNYNEKCDIWSIGVILYFLIEGKPPFMGQNDGEIKLKIKSMKYKFSEEWEKYSEKGEVVKDLIKHMLIKEDERYTAQQVLDHPWINKEKKFTTIDIEDILNQIKLYQKMDNFEKKIISFIASRLNSNEIENLKNFFVFLDQNNDGKISYKEFCDGMAKISSEPIKEEEIKSFFDNIDTNEDGSLEYTEFIAACINNGFYLNKNNLKEIFDAIDKKKTGKISKDEIISVLELEETCPSIYENYINQLEKDENGKIDFEQFIKMISIIIAETLKK